MARILDSLVGFNVVVTMAGNAIDGTLVSVDPHGLLLRVDDPKSQDQIKEKYAIFVPHKNVEMVHAREDHNGHMTPFNEYELAFGRK